MGIQGNQVSGHFEAISAFGLLEFDDALGLILLICPCVSGILVALHIFVGRGGPTPTGAWFSMARLFLACVDISNAVGILAIVRPAAKGASTDSSRSVSHLWI